jgi:hypothetical protein
MQITANLIFTTSSGQNAELTAGTNGMQFNSPLAGKDITFLLQGSNPVVLKSNGNVTLNGSLGVGTASPATKLHIIGGSNDVLRVETTTNTANVIFTTTAGQSGEFTASVNGMQFNSPLAGKDITFVTQGANPIVFKSGGNVGIGTTSPSTKLHVAGDVTVDGVISASYSDLAEWVQADRPLPDGTVVVLDKRRINGVIASSRPYDLSVAGVVSATPGVLLGQAGKDKLKVATTGRVKVKVDASNAPIEIGDLLVSSGREGMAMRSDPVEVANIKMHRPGTLIGKALEPLAGGEGEILVLLSLQ